MMGTEGKSEGKHTHRTHEAKGTQTDRNWKQYLSVWCGGVGGKLKASLELRARPTEPRPSLSSVRDHGDSHVGSRVS